MTEQNKLVICCLAVLVESLLRATLEEMRGVCIKGICFLSRVVTCSLNIFFVYRVSCLVNTESCRGNDSKCVFECFYQLQLSVSISGSCLLSLFFSNLKTKLLV